MTYEFEDMTMSEMLRDPMIRQMLRADGVSLSDFAVMLDDAARQSNKAGREAALVIPAAHIVAQSTAQMCCTKSL
ncbi:hypothetical protein H4S14_004081 [Agrobacterium vitis]|nr:hypothetical protein [Agrobacterium vitis]MBE1440308.1 hypothetical protein [Agrobacterium vitis]